MTASSQHVHSCALSPQPGPARHQLLELLEHADWPGDVDAVVLAVHEALINSLRHAGGATSASAGLAGRELIVEVCDAGPGFDVEGHAGDRPDAFAEQGRGLWLISQIAASWELHRDNEETCLILRFRP